MNPPDSPGRGPAGPLGQAFADLGADAPPTNLSAAGVIATAHAESHRRHRWVLGTGVAAAVVAVSTLIGVSVVQSGASSDSASAGPSSAASNASAPALASSPPGKPEAGSGTGGGAPAPGAQDGGEAAPTSADCVAGFSGAQQAAVIAALPGVVAGADCSGISGDGVIAASTFAGEGVTVTVVMSAGEGGCPENDERSCATVEGHPDAVVLAAPADRPVNEGTSTTVIGADGGRTVAITVDRDGAAGELPYPVDDLASLAETLLGR